MTLDAATQVIAAGSPSQVAAAMADAEPLREQLQERGVLVVPLPIFAGAPEGNGAAASYGVSSSGNGDREADLRCAISMLRCSAW